MKKGKKLKKQVDELPKIQSTSQVVVNVKPGTKEDVKELPGYEETPCVVPNFTGKSVCWNCCHCIEGKVLSQPLKYDKGVFTTNGNFCSFPCISRYIVEKNETSDVIFNHISLLNLYVNIMNNKTGLKVSPAPPRLALTMFGGYMDINEYRNNNKDHFTIMNIDPIVCCVDMSLKKLDYKKHNVSENKKEFKLYRRNKKINTNDIYSSMNLISE
jgi:hypothetical protein